MRRLLAVSAVLALGACAETRSSGTVAVPTSAAPTARYPLTMRADVAGADDVPMSAPDDPLVHIGLWAMDGRELMSGLFDRGASAFVAQSVFVLGMLPEEMAAQDLGSFADQIAADEAAFLLGCSDPEERWLFLEAQGAASDAEAVGRQQLLLAIGGLVALLREREVGALPEAMGDDPCEPLEDEDDCTWAPEFYQDACCAHDDCYAGCAETGVAREECDRLFRAGMTAEATVWTLPFVESYHAAVRAFGQEFFPCPGDSVRR
ncbi:MAG: hypothetical protein AAF726_20810 [Planctomycetota bacterium]